MLNPISEQSWLLSEASVRGKGHIDNGLPNQDSVAVRTSADGAIVSAIVSDGAGSALRSAEGSKITAEFMVSWMLQIGEDVHSGVLPLAQVRDRLMTGIIELRKLLNAKGDSLKDFHCTLVGCLILPSGGMICQIGDSIAFSSKAITVGDNGVDFFPTDQCKKYEVERGEYSNETHFVTESNWHQHLRIAPLPDTFDSVVMMTDGAMDIATLNGAVFRGFLSNLIGNLLNNDDRERRGSIINEWLADTKTYPVTADDKTIFIAIRRECVAFSKLTPIVDANVSINVANSNATALDAIESTPIRKGKSNNSSVNQNGDFSLIVEEVVTKQPPSSEARFSFKRKNLFWISMIFFVVILCILTFSAVLNQKPNPIDERKGRVQKEDPLDTSIPKPVKQKEVVNTSNTKTSVVVLSALKDNNYAIGRNDEISLTLSLNEGDFAKLKMEEFAEKTGLRFKKDEQSCFPSVTLNIKQLTCKIFVASTKDAPFGKHALIIDLEDNQGQRLNPLQITIEINSKKNDLKVESVAASSSTSASIQATKSVSAPATSANPATTAASVAASTTAVGRNKQ